MVVQVGQAPTYMVIPLQFQTAWNAADMDDFEDRDSVDPKDVLDQVFKLRERISQSPR